MLQAVVQTASQSAFARLLVAWLVTQFGLLWSLQWQVQLHFAGGATQLPLQHA
jgi:hypothetical protein